MKQPDLGKKIAELRKAKSLTQEELVEKCNLNVRTLQRIEAGVVTPRSHTIRVIFACLDYKDSFEYMPIEFSETKNVSANWQERFYSYVFDIFNLKTNKMKKLSILTVSFIFIVISLFFIIADIKAQKYTIVIDAGHGGKDAGAQIRENAIEKNIALSIAKLLREKTKVRTDFKLILTREKDEFMELEKRIDKTKETKADLFISIHINSSSNNKLSGIECYTAFVSDFKTKSENIGRLFIDEFKLLKDIKTEDSIKQATYTILKESPCPALLLNIGYLTNSNDLAYVSDIHNQSLICDMIIKAIERIDK